MAFFAFAPTAKILLFDLKGSRKEKSSYKRKIYDFILGLQKNQKTEKPPLYVNTFPIDGNVKIKHVEHHLAHAAAAYYTSGINEKQLIITLDGAGDIISGAIWRGENNKIIKLKNFPKSGSLGYFYSIGQISANFTRSQRRFRHSRNEDGGQIC